MELKKYLKEIDTEKKEQVIIGMLVCLQLANDMMVEYFNDGFVRSMERKADRLQTMESFGKIYRRLRTSLGNEGFIQYIGKITDYADRMDYLRESLFNSFYSDAVKKVKYEHCRILCCHLTLKLLLDVSNIIYMKLFGISNRLIDETERNLDMFGNRIKIQMLNDDENVIIGNEDTEKILVEFCNRLFEMLNIK